MINVDHSGFGHFSLDNVVHRSRLDGQNLKRIQKIIRFLNLFERILRKELQNMTNISLVEMQEEKSPKNLVVLALEDENKNHIVRS